MIPLQQREETCRGNSAFESTQKYYIEKFLKNVTTQTDLLQLLLCSNTKSLSFLKLKKQYFFGNFALKKLFGE
jgi:hypothetical protein